VAVFERGGGWGILTQVGFFRQTRKAVGESGGDEGDASVPTLPLIRSRPYGKRGSPACSEKPYWWKVRGLG